MHFQWLAVQPLDVQLLPARAARACSPPTTCCRASRAPASSPRQRRLYERVDAVVVHSEHGAERLRGELGIDPGHVHVIPHGAFHHLAAQPDGAPLPPELRRRRAARSSSASA